MNDKWVTRFLCRSEERGIYWNTGYVRRIHDGRETLCHSEFLKFGI